MQLGLIHLQIKHNNSTHLSWVSYPMMLDGLALVNYCVIDSALRLRYCMIGSCFSLKWLDSHLERIDRLYQSHFSHCHSIAGFQIYYCIAVDVCNCLLASCELIWGVMWPSCCIMTNV